MNTKTIQKVDYTALKTNQAMIIILNIVAFIVIAPWLAGIVTVVMIIGTFLKKPGFVFIYKALKPTGWPKQEVISDNPEPHLFAQGFGAVVMIAGIGALYSGLAGLGWGLVWLVVALAALNLFGGFCVGCAIYYWLGRLDVPGFAKTPPEGTFPGMKPKLGA